MNIFVILALALLIIMVLLRRHVPIGPAILAAGFFIWATTAPQFHYLPDALYTTLTSARTYDLILALYFVMCLEIELRTGGVLDGMVRALHHLLRSPKLTLGLSGASALARRRTFFRTDCGRRGQKFRADGRTQSQYQLLVPPYF